MYPDELAHYLEIQETSFNILCEISNELHIKISSIRWHHISDYFINEKNTVLEPLNAHTFTTLTSNKYGVYGITIKKNTLAVIYYNHECVSGRQHFTILHEISHIILHSTKNSTFSSLISDSNYTEEDMIKENEANMLAGLLLINDEALAQYINNKMPFNDLCQEFEISHQALQTRLTKYIYFNRLKANIDAQIWDIEDFKYIKNPYAYAVELSKQYCLGKSIYLK